MGLTDSSIIQISSLALDGLSARHKAITSNIANAETPDYKRIDVVFEDQLSKFIKSEEIKDAQKIKNSAGNGTNAPLSVNYNQAIMKMEDFKPVTVESDENQPNEKGNTVNIEREMSTLAKNGMTYNAIATLQAKEFRNLNEVVRSSQ